MASFRKRGSKWQYRITYHENGERKEISKSGFATKAEAKIHADKIEHELNFGLQINKGDQLFTEYYSQWIKTYKLGAFSPETDRFYETGEKIVHEYFPGKKLKEISREDYQSFLNKYAENNGNMRAKETVRKMHYKIGASLDDAHANGYIPNNPTHRAIIRGMDGVKESEKYLNEGEAKKLLEALLDGLKISYISRYLLILQLATGMRVSEAMAITFKDINFKDRTLNIDKSWDYKFYHEFKPTKNKTTRKITVDQTTLNILRPLYDHQRSKKIQDQHQRLFESNGEVPSINAINKALKRACERSNVPVVTSHALRHTHASILLLNGISLPYISRRLGHRDITTTADIYAHVLKELEIKNDQESADIFYDIYTHS